MGKWWLLSESKNKILRGWYILSALLIVFVLIQQVTGKIESVEGTIEGTVWLWVFVQILPCALLLNTYIFINKYSDKAIHPNIHKALQGGSILFFILVFMTFFLSQAAIEMNDYGLDVYFSKSYKYLLPVNLLLLIGMGFVFLTQKNFLKPANEAIIAIAKEKEAQAIQKAKLKRRACLSHIIAHDFDKTFDTMKAFFEGQDAELSKHLTLLQSQYSQIIEEKKLNTIEEDKAQTTLNRITIGLIDLAENIDS